MEKTIGGDRIGAGKKMTVDLHGYGRSTHDMSYITRTTMASGTLVPFITELGLPGDSFDINLNVDVKTHPTIGPLFGSFKVQVDVYVCPIRLYQAQLHNNRMGIGMKMSTVKLPQLELKAKQPLWTENLDNSQINPSSLLSYINIRGLGYNFTAPTEEVVRQFNALPFISYWDIYKNYYANKQEEIGVVIHSDNQITENVTGAGFYGHAVIHQGINVNQNFTFNIGDILFFDAPTIKNQDDFVYTIKKFYKIEIETVPLNELPFVWSWNAATNKLEGICSINAYNIDMYGWDYNMNGKINSVPKLKSFPLKNIDDMRQKLQSYFSGAPYIIDEHEIEPYNLICKKYGDNYSKMNSQEGLAVKTYQSDLFNNWMNTEWIDGVSGINAITAIDTSSGHFSIDTLNLSKKVYDMLNRIAISGGTYDDWTQSVYDHKSFTRAETPIYVGGLSKELIFQEVISNGSNDNQPLGTLAGKGAMGQKNKGGSVNIKIDEPSYIMGIISLTPRVDYSQGNKWDTNLKTMDDFHKPALDQIGFQNLITDQMAWWDTRIIAGQPTYNSAGKQPAWMNYMTNVNVTRGNFAIQSNEMFMTLNRRYEIGTGTGILSNIKDLTTYIDPVKFNFIFAETSRDAQNFWVQIGTNMIVRRKMSAKIMPNL